jgi:hypothetical protein
MEILKISIIFDDAVGEVLPHEGVADGVVLYYSL